MTEITVVTITRGRPDMLWRCIASVERQDYSGGFEQLVIIDDCPETLASLQKASNIPKGVRYIYMKRSPKDRNGPARLAYLRNFSAFQMPSAWMSFLDDDNEFEREHLSSLYETVQSQDFDAVFSYDRILKANGRPFLERYWPWARTRDEAEKLYEFYCSVGVLTPGSNLQKHTIQTDPGRPVVLWVDTNVWLFKRDLLRKHPIPIEYDHADWKGLITEDDKMLVSFVKAGLKIGCTYKPTVRYYLGGYSNRFDSDAPASEVWNDDNIPPPSPIDAKP